MGDSVGFRFRPTQQELIYLLRCKAQGIEISTVTDSVVEENLYGEGKEPWRIFSGNEKWEIYDESGKKDTKRVIYVVTKLSKMSAKMTVRTAGRGTWDRQTKPKPVENYEGNNVIGWMKRLNYVLDQGYESEAVGKGYYYMHEYSVSEDYLREVGIESTDYVICRIIKDDSKCSSVKYVKGDGRNVKRHKVGFQEAGGEMNCINNVYEGSNDYAEGDLVNDLRENISSRG